VPAETAAQTLVLGYNDAAQLEAAFRTLGDSIACVIVEPVAGNMNLVPPRQGFLQLARELCSRHGSVLIFDEVMTGFRVGLEGAQGLYGVRADLVTLGKVIGGGMPLGAFGGRRDIMEKIAPLGPVYQAGTLSGNPIAVAAGIATLRKIQLPGFYERLAAIARSLCDGLVAAARRYNVPFSAHSVGGMFGVYFRDMPPSTYAEVMQCDKEAFNRFFHAMLAKGMYFAPSAYEAGFVSAVHSAADIAATTAAADAVFKTMS
jgi:glutamate-1-semialdehyde 2,1-aminomutase